MSVPAEDVETNRPLALALAAAASSVDASPLGSSTGRNFAGAEKRVLEHAADILGVPYETLVTLGSTSDNTSGIFSRFTRY